MHTAARLTQAKVMQQCDSAERALNKLARTFKIEALKRYRSGGEQKVTVEHVHVHKGGQAIVGYVAAAACTAGRHPARRKGIAMRGSMGTTRKSLSGDAALCRPWHGSARHRS
jgi:hypothetical protein